MKYSPKNYKQDIKRFNELALLLKSKKKNIKDPVNKKIFEKAENEYESLENKLKKDYDKKHEEEKFKKEQEEIREESVKAAKEHARRLPVYDRDGKLIDGDPTYTKGSISLKKRDPDVEKKIAELENETEDDIARAERLYEGDLKEVKEETTITTKADGTEIVEVKKKLVKPEIYMQEPRYTKNQLRHKKFYEGKESREDLSEEVKAILMGKAVPSAAKDVDKRVKSAGLPPAKFVGKAGGKRKILCCPHCDGEMIATGVKATTADNTRQKTPAMKAWHDLIKAVGEMPEHKGKKRPELMPIASALKEKHGGSVNAISAMFQGEV